MESAQNWNVADSPTLKRHNVTILGRGSKVVVLGHGFGGTQAIWDHVLPYFDLDVYQIVKFDLFGAASTSVDAYDCSRYSSLHGFADDLLEILSELEIAKCWYIGHSVSGMVGMLASIEAPYLFEQIISLGASPRYLNDGGYSGGFKVADLDKAFQAMKSNFLSWASGFGEVMVGANMESPQVREYCDSLCRMRPDVALGIFKTIFNSDTRAILPQVTVPVHVLQTANDAAVPMGAALYIYKHVQQPVCLDVLPVSGHMPHLTAPQIVGPGLIRHLEHLCPHGDSVSRSEERGSET